MAILYGEIDKDTKREKIHYNRGDMVASQTINDIQDTAIDAHNMATEALDKADSVFQGNGTVVSVGGREVGTLAFTSDPQQQLDTLNSKISTASSFNAEIVDQLPTENISTSTFYLIKNSTSADDNTYSEYLYVNGKWELLGNTQVQAYDDSELRELINGLSTTKANKTDLANYYTKDQTYNITEVDAKVINLVSTSYLTSQLNPINTSINTLNSTVANKVDTDTFNTETARLQGGIKDNTDEILEIQEREANYITKDVNNLTNYTKSAGLSEVAKSNSYEDLDNKPVIPSKLPTPNKLTIRVTNNTPVFFDGSEAKEINIDIPDIGSLVDIINNQNDVIADLELDIRANTNAISDKADADDVTANTNAISTINSKLSGIQSGAEVNVQSDWNVTDTSSDAYIKNKPTIPSISGLATETYVNTQVDTLQGKIDGKQDTISDLATIRSGASAGATAVQPSTLDGYYTKAQTENRLNGEVSTINQILDRLDTSTTTNLNSIIELDERKVNKSTTINSKPLSSHITLTASDVDALPSDTELFSGSYNDLTDKPNLFSGNYNDLSNKPTIPTTASQVGALPDTTKYGATLSLTMNDTDYKVIAQLKDQAGNNLGTAQTIDLPLESVVVSGSYDATNKKVILTLKDGSTIDFSVADLVSGLVSDTRKVAGIDLKDDITTTELSTALNLSQYANKVTSVNGKTGAVSLGAGDVGALPNTTTIPKLYDEMGENTDGAITQQALSEIIIALGDEFGGVISELNTNKANKSDLDAKYTKPSTGIPKTDLASDVQTSLGKADTALQSVPAEYITETELNAKGYASQSDLDTTNTNVSANTTAINNRYTKDEILNMFKIYADADTALKNRVTATETAISELEDYKADKIDTQAQYNTLSTNKADKTELESAVTTLNETIDDVRELIGESQGTVVRFGETPQPEVIFTSNPQDQIDALNEKTGDLVGKTYYVIDEDYGYKYSRGEIFNDYDSNVASGVYSHAEGSLTDATGQYSHAEGFSSLASGNYSHAEGNSTASGLYAHSEGKYTTASADFSHAQGLNTTASHQASSAIGSNTKTGRDCQSVAGIWNVGKNDTLFEVGNGYYDDVYGQVVNQNAFEVQEDGTLYTQNGTLTDGTNSVSLGNVATKDEIPTNYVTTDTDQNISGQKVFNDIHTTNTITFHNNNADYNATYKGFIYQYKDQLDISRDKEADSSDFSGVFSLKLGSKELYIGGKKVASVENGMYLQGSTISVSFPTGSYSAGSTTTLISSAPANGWYTASVNVTGNSWFQCAGYSYRPQAVSNGYSIQFVIPVPKGSKLTFYASGATTVKNVYVSTFIQSKET